MATGVQQLPSLTCHSGVLQADDYIVEYDGGFKLACDPKSLLYLFGMKLDYSDALIGGGFNFRWGCTATHFERRRLLCGLQY